MSATTDRKVNLVVRPFPELPHLPNDRVSNMTKSLPFFQTKPGSYVHRVRHGYIFFSDGKFTHSAVNYWCGGSGFPNHMRSRRVGGTFYAEPPVGEICCATCEGRAVGAGLAGAPVICGHPVKFAPRLTRGERNIQRRMAALANSDVEPEPIGHA